MPDPTFVNYSHPHDQTDRRNRRIVASYIGTHYRNRSRPSARKASKAIQASPKYRSGLTPSDEEVPDAKQTILQIRKREHPSNLSPIGSHALPFKVVNHDKHGLRSDPFNTYPIEFRASLPAAIDFCENSSSACVAQF